MAKEQVSGTVEDAVAEGGAYEVIRKRLLGQASALESTVSALNQRREEEFGKEKIEVVARFRARTENNCVPRDIVKVGNQMLFGYNVFIGLKKETQVSDVFSLYEIKIDENGFDAEPLAIKDTFLADARFEQDFKELYDYYKETRLIQLQVYREKLLATFQIGLKLEDIRVFRWEITTDGQIKYIDDRGERDLRQTASHDFEWHRTTREDQVLGDHPHLSILDKVFVETINGDLTIKLENNTSSGVGIYEEPVDDEHQSLDDADVLFAELGNIILLKIRPYRETVWRYFVVNLRTEEAIRLDGIGHACQRLPEDHGIIFPGGIYLENGESKEFDQDFDGFNFKRLIKSPNGEDVLYIFYEPEHGEIALFPYNLIRKEIANPMLGHGYCLFDNGHLVLFKEDGAEPIRIHPMQIFTTPFVSQEFAANQEKAEGMLATIGNAELVRGISDLLSLSRSIKDETISIAHYEDIIAQCQKLQDNYFWFENDELGDFIAQLKTIKETSELVLDEYEKVESIQKHSKNELNSAERSLKTLFSRLNPSEWNKPKQFAEALREINQSRGHLLSLRELRYVDNNRIDELETKLVAEQDRISKATVDFMQKDEALDDYYKTIEQLLEAIEKATSAFELKSVKEELNTISEGLDLIVELFNAIQIEDTTKRTAILEGIAKIFSELNQVKAKLRLKTKSLGRDEALADFSTQMTLLSQSTTSAIGMVETLEECEQQQSRLLIQVEEIESKFSDFDEFLTELVEKREEIVEVFSTKKQQLQQEQQRKVQSMQQGANRILESVSRRLGKFSSQDELNTFFSSDAMIQKVNQICARLREFDNAIIADDVEAKLKGLKDQGIRSLRDKLDLFTEGGNVISLGRHKFSVNTQALELTVVNDGKQLSTHLLGTNYYHVFEDPRLTELKDFWEAHLVSESDAVYRAEYLAYKILRQAEKSDSLKTLFEQVDDSDALENFVKSKASENYQDGYEKGIHDHDATLILKELLPVYQKAGLLRYSSLTRALACVFWHEFSDATLKSNWQILAANADNLSTTFGSIEAKQQLITEISPYVETLIASHNPYLPTNFQADMVAAFLVDVIKKEQVVWPLYIGAKRLEEAFFRHLQSIDERNDMLEQIRKLDGNIGAQWLICHNWLVAYVTKTDSTHSAFIPELCASIIYEAGVFEQIDSHIDISVNDLLGGHKNIVDRRLEINLAEFLERLHHHETQWIPKFKGFTSLRQSLLQEEKDLLRLEQYQAKPLSSFVRNKLINDTYLPVIGDNLAKQMGTVGDKRRTDLMGLLLLISPPGYGKTTLMEYVANRLGLIFMKINCPSIGHNVTSLDPTTADNSTARQELEKLNLGLEMGNNVMLYLDDIQHTNPEFLQKFISLCDGSRRIEGVWKGKTKTYDLRGKKFCVIMAGNPYTESGEVFKIPDMLANRADIYNLGDMLSGNEDSFALSYIENALTSNPVLQPMATREMTDVYKVVKMAQGENIASTELSHSYNGAELNEIVTVMKNLFVIRDVVWRVNQEYIRSAATADRYRTEPAFKLQGSYRNMNKMAEKVSAIMDKNELQALIDDHYQGEAQLLTSGAEENLLKLAQMRGQLSTEQEARWQGILKDFARNKAMGGDDADGSTKIANQIAQINDAITDIGPSFQRDTRLIRSVMQISKHLKSFEGALKSLETKSESSQESAGQLQIVLERQPEVGVALKQIADVYENYFMPVIKSMSHKFNLDMNLLNKINKVEHELKKIISPDQNAEFKEDEVDIYDYEYDKKSGAYKRKPPSDEE